MLLIGICDGERAVRSLLGDYIRRYRDETGLPVQILSYDNEEKLLRHYPFEMDLIFLSGIAVAKRIRAVDENVGIVFLTSVLSYVLEAYEVRPNNYLIKPLKYSRFLKEVETARARRGQNRFFIENNTEGVYKVYTKSIRYIETDGRNTRIHVQEEGILSHKPMKTHEQALFEPYFVRCHTGFIVNLLFFQKLEQNDLVLTTGEKIPVSRYRKKEVVKKINDLYSEVKNHEKN